MDTEIVIKLHTPVSAIVAIREKQYIVQRHINGVNWADMVVTQGLAGRPMISKNNITVVGIFILVRNNNSNFVSCRQIFMMLISFICGLKIIYDGVDVVCAWSHSAAVWYNVIKGLPISCSISIRCHKMSALSCRLVCRRILVAQAES